MRDDHVNEAPDFTNSALLMGAVNLTWIFTLIWALFGMGPVLIVALCLNHAITRFGQMRRR